MAVRALGLGELGRELACRGKNYGFEAALDDGGWESWSAVVHGPRLAEFAQDARDAGLRRDAAGARLGGRMTNPVIARSTAAWLYGLRVLDLSDGAVWVDRTGEKFTRLAFLRLGDGTTVDEWASHLVNALAPAFEAVCAQVGFSRPGLWSGAVARIGTTAVGLDRAAGGTGAIGWVHAQPLLDAMDRHVPVRVARPTSRTVGVEDQHGTWSIKGACCLKYRTKEASDVTTGAGYCSTCPLIEEQALVTGLRAKLFRA
nr:(2Fe-2S)-binding protein [Micromonospora sp. DSM 115978]